MFHRNRERCGRKSHPRKLANDVSRLISPSTRCYIRKCNVKRPILSLLSPIISSTGSFDSRERGKVVSPRAERRLTRFNFNQIYVVEADDDQAADGDRADRDKRKIGVLKLGLTNGIINFVFGVR